GLGQEEGEDLAAELGDGVDPALGALEHVGDGLEAVVRLAVAELVVDLLEVVEVEHGDGHLALAALGALELLLEELLEAGGIEKASARVALGGLGEVVDQALYAAAQCADEAGGQHGRSDREQPLPGADVRVDVVDHQVDGVERRDEAKLDEGAAAAEQER